MTNSYIDYEGPTTRPVGEEDISRPLTTGIDGCLFLGTQLGSFTSFKDYISDGVVSAKHAKPSPSQSFGVLVVNHTQPELGTNNEFPGWHPKSQSPAGEGR